MRETFHFQENENYNIRSGTYLASRNMRATLFGKETVSNLGANGNQQVVHVGFVRHIFNTLALSKVASYENSFWNFMRK